MRVLRCEDENKKKIIDTEENTSNIKKKLFLTSATWREDALKYSKLLLQTLATQTEQKTYYNIRENSIESKAIKKINKLINHYLKEQ